MAGLISKETIDNVNNLTDIVSLVGEYTKLTRKSGNDHWGCCPFHHEKTSSFHVDGDSKFYHCFGCGVSGGATKFLMEMEKISFVDAVTTLAKRANIEIKYDGNGQKKDEPYDNTKDLILDLYERVTSMFHYFLMETEQGKEALEYLLNRGLTKETIEKFRLGYAPQDRHWLKKFLKSKNYSDEFLLKSGLFSQNYPDISFFNDRIMYPIFNRKGQTCAYSGRILHSKGPDDRKYMNTGEMVQYKKKETLYAFNFAKEAIRRTKSIIICEGNMDVISYHQAGIDYAVATCGTALTEDHMKLIRGFAETVYLAFDSDDAGQKATYKSILLCRSFDFTVKIIRLKGGKDASEILQKYGKENLTNQVNLSILDSDYLLNILGEKYQLDTPEGKTKAALAFFPYIDSLQSDIHKESSLEQLSQSLNLKPEAVKRDFLNRNLAVERVQTKTSRQENKTIQTAPLKLDAELRGILAVTRNIELFKVLRSKISESDLQNPAAVKLFKTMSQCDDEGKYSVPNIMDRLGDESLCSLVANAISSGAYSDENTEDIVTDTIEFITRSKLERKRDELMRIIKNFIPVTEEDKETLQDFLSEKMELDKKLNH